MLILAQSKIDTFCTKLKATVRSHYLSQVMCWLVIVNFVGIVMGTYYV